MEFFDKVFNWIEQISLKVGNFDVKAYFFIVLGIILAVGIIVGLTFFDSTRFKLLKASKRIINYLKDVENVDDDNLAEFTERCFSDSVPKSLKSAWIEFLGVRFGYPSEIISQANVYDKEVNRADNVRPNIFLTIGLILVGLFAFFGYGPLEKTAMSVIWLLGLVLVAVIYIILVMIGKSLNKKSLNTFYEMQEDIDAKVNLPIETNYSTDGSPLSEAASIIDEIIAKNISRERESEYEEVIPDMGEEVVLNPVEKNYVLKKAPVYVPVEYNERKIVPTVPKIKKKLFKKATVVEDEASKIEQAPPVEIDLEKIEEKKAKAEEKKQVKKVAKKTKQQKKVVPQEVKVEEKVETPVVEEEVKVDPIPVVSKSDFDTEGEAFVPISLDTQEEKIEVVEETPVEEKIEAPIVEETKTVEEPVTEEKMEVVEEVPEEKVEESIVEEAPVVDEKVEEIVVEETPVEENEPVEEIHLQTITNIEEDENEENDIPDTMPNIGLGGNVGMHDVMATDAFGGSVLPPKSKEEFEAEKQAKKSKKKK